MRFCRDIFAGVTMAMASLAVFAAVASMLQQAGMDFAGSFTAGALLSLVGTLWSAFKRYGIVLVPSLTVTGYLVFIAAVSHGLGWQAVMGISFLSSFLGLFFLWGSKYIPCRELPAIFPWGIKLALAVFLIGLGLKMGRIVITSPWQVTMLGDPADPLMYWSMAGIVLTLVLVAGGWRSALFIGMVVAGVVTFIEGFWVIPAAPFFLPEGVDKVIGQLTFSAPDAKSSIFYGMTVFSLVILLSVVHWSTAASLSQTDKPAEVIRFLFVLGTIGALCGVPPLVISPVSAAISMGQNSSKSLATVVLLFAFALFAEPTIAAVAAFPAMVVPVLAGSGFCLLLNALNQCPLSEQKEERRVEVLAISVLVLLLLLTGDFATAVGFSLIGYALFMSMSGRFRQVAGSVWLISGIFVFYYVYGSMF